MSKTEESLETKKEYPEGGSGKWQTSKGGGGGTNIYILFLPDPSLIQDSLLSQIIKNFNLQANIDIWMKRLWR